MASSEHSSEGPASSHGGGAPVQAFENSAPAPSLSGKDRLRSFILPPSVAPERQDRVVNVKKLDSRASKALLDGVLKDNQNDQSVLLDKVRQRLETAGLTPPCVEVRYEKLSASVNTVVASSHIPNIFKSMTGGLFVKKEAQTHPTQLELLSPCCGVLRPGRLALVLGPPGSGRSTFLRALAGRAQGQKELTVSGEVTYNGKGFDAFAAERAAAYISQSDTHYGELTVRETMAFAAECFGARPLRELLEVLHDKEEAQGITPDPAVDAFMKASAWGGSNTVDVERTIRLLGLEKCSDTVVGNAMLRGVSGGEKKRVTSGEVLVGPARVFLGDEISTGLDSQTTFTVCKYLQGWVRALNGTAAMALLQPTPETFELFDDVILMSAGVVVYNGPREGVLSFFSKLGFECPARCGVAEFMQEVTTPTDQQKYWSYPGGREYEFVTAAAMADAFDETDAAQKTSILLDKPYAPPNGDRRMADIHLPTEKYGATYSKMWKANAARASKLQSRRKLFIYVRWFQVFIMSLVAGTLYIKVRDKTTIDDGNVIMGGLFFSMIYMLMAGAAEMYVLEERLAVFFRQREMHMYPGSAFAVPSFLWRIPYCGVDAFLWSVIFYWIAGLDADAGRFFMFVLLMFLTAIWSTSFHQAVVASVNATIAHSVSMLIIMILIVAGGFIILRNDIPDGWIAAYWANPWAYLTQSFAINEFTGESWNKPNPADPDGPPLGLAVLSFRGLNSAYSNVWLGVGVVLASTAINLLIFVLAATFRPAPVRKGFITVDQLEELEFTRIKSDKKGSKALPASMKIDIELGMRRSASMAKIAAAKGSSSNLAALGGSTGNLTALPGQTSGPITPISSIPFEPLNLTFQDVGYSVPVPKSTGPGDTRIAKEGPHAGQLQLLHHVSGSFRPGIVTALMGASGAGKTTLMDVLAGRKTGGTTTGDIRVNGHPKEQVTFARVSAYVEQEDCHLEEPTVEEALAFSAALRLPSTVSAEKRGTFVNEVISLVELQRVRGVVIGHVGGTGLTIEQRKRLTIAVELVSNPSVLFMDEPTTGLDARGAAIVAAAVRATAATGRTVVCTIHQPSYAVFSGTFDELVVLKPGGRCIFNGDLGSDASLLIDYFSSIPGVEPIRDGANPANWMLEQTAPRREAELAVDFSHVFAKSAVAAQTHAVIEAAAQLPPGSHPLLFEDMNVRPVHMQFWFLLKRLFVAYWRMTTYLLTRLAVTVLVAFVFGTIFWNQGTDYSSPAGVLNIAGVLFMAVLFTGVTNALTIQKIISEQRRVFYREGAAGMYGPTPFGLAQGVVEIPFLLIQAVIFTFPVYYMIGLSTESAKVGWFFLYLLLTLWYFTEYGAVCVNVTPDLGIATLLTSFIFSFLNLFSGFMIPSEKMGWWWRWFVYINPVAYTLYGLLTSQLGDVQATFTDFTGAEVTVAEFLEERFGYDFSMRGPIVAILIAFILIFRGMSIYALKNFNFQNR